MEITDDIKYKVLLQYFGCKVIHKNMGIVCDWTTITENTYKRFKDESFKLVLKPISAITDEDAMEVSKICYKENFRKIKRYHDHIELEIDDLNDLRIYFNAEIKTAWRETVSCKDIESDEQLLTYINCIDYLRSKGYDTPQYLLGGKTLFDCELAIYEN